MPAIRAVDPEQTRLSLSEHRRVSRRCPPESITRPRSDGSPPATTTDRRAPSPVVVTRRDDAAAPDERLAVDRDSLREDLIGGLDTDCHRACRPDGRVAQRQDRDCEVPRVRGVLYAELVEAMRAVRGEHGLHGPVDFLGRRVAERRVPRGVEQRLRPVETPEDGRR
jgi:hypothetical protein